MQAVETLGAAVVLVLAVAVMLARTPEAAATVFAWAAVPQAVIAVVLAGWGGMPALFVDAAAILVVKGLWAPKVLRRALRHGGEVYSQHSVFSSSALLLGAGAVALLCLRVGLIILPDTGVAFGLGLAAMFVGLGTAGIRVELWAQAAGMLIGEAGLMTSALVLSGGLPPLGEIFALAEVLLLAAVLAAVTRLVRTSHGGTDSRLLRGLRG